MSEKDQPKTKRKMYHKLKSRDAKRYKIDEKDTEEKQE